MYRRQSEYATCFIALAFCSVAFAACDSTEPPENDPGEQELITRIVLTLSPVGGGQTVTAEASDPDGDGTGFVIDTLFVTADSTYNGTIELIDDVNGEDITEEVRAEDDEHQFFYVEGGGVADRITVTTTDEDDNGLPVGLSYTVEVSAGDAATGTLQVVLSHYDEEPKDGVNRSDETDVDVTFPVNIQ